MGNTTAKTNSRLATLPAPATVFCNTLVALIGFAAPSFAESISVLQTPTNFNGVVDLLAINDNGLSVGSFGNPNGSFSLFTASPSGYTILSSNAYGYTRGINDSGMIGGAIPATDNTSAQPAVYSAAGVSLPALPPGYTGGSAEAINNSGQIAGNLFGASGSTAMIGNASSVTAIPGLAAYPDSIANGINSSGQVAGVADYDGRNQFVFFGTTSGASIVPLPVGWGGGDVYVAGLNSSGEIAGFGYASPSSPTVQGFIGTSSGLTAIPFESGFTNSSVDGIDDAGQVLGSSSNTNVTNFWLWDPVNGYTILNSIVPSWTIDDVFRISPDGTILASAYQDADPNQTSVYVEITSPSPEPSPGILAAAGLLLIGVHWKRRLWKRA